MGLQPSVNYTRKRIIGNACLPSLRRLSKSLGHWSDRDLGNILDMAVDARMRNEEAEIWWEDDPAFGICANRVVRVDEDLPVADSDSIYAIVRDASQGDGEIIISILNQDTYDQSITNDRWRAERPEKSRYRHIDDEEEKEENMEEIHPDAEGSPRDDLDLVLVQHTINHDMKFTPCSKDELLTVILRLITKDGADPTNIYVWRDSRRASIKVELEE